MKAFSLPVGRIHPGTSTEILPITDEGRAVFDRMAQGWKDLVETVGAVAGQGTQGLEPRVWNRNTKYDTRLTRF